ncbi:hypothetical protein [Candidatus Erwinia dacicola]|nr:hypothetical protein [Candidatus Erwinia dacicola]
MAKHFTPEFKLEAAKLVVDHRYTCRYRCKSDPPRVKMAVLRHCQ